MEVTVTLAFASTVTVSKTILPMVQYIPRSGMKVGDPRHSSQSNDEKAKLWKTRLRGDLINMYKYLKVQVSAVEVNTPEEMFVENGTDAKLPCTFTSVEVISSAASVSWSFQPEGAATRISFFYYSNGKSYPGKDIPFKDRITWAGDLNKKDASITISNMQFRDNGTYICDVKNPPDIVVKPGEIRVRVVEKDSLPAFPIATVAGIAIGTVTGLSSLISIVVCLVIRKNNSKKRYSGAQSFTRS
ncbi:myelin protein zero-like protein 1 isoform X7 [Anomalospiza imberbis]|uniref:myelin protein zero-like protein 1 isoform X7 n=1 Tax=Anomalospiza imberbis TaxID=187417 RepID=UPI00358E2251